jgi:hypothetical protein
MILFFIFLFNVDIDFEELYDKATTRLVSYRAVKDSAVEQFIELGKDPITSETTIMFLVSKFDTKSSIERHTLKDILKEIGTPAVEWIVERMSYRGSEAAARSLKQSLWVLGEIGGEEIIEPAAPFVDDDEWTVRSGALTALGKSGSYKALPQVLGCLMDTVALVRKSAFYALSEIATEAELIYLLKGISDPYYGVRYAALGGLKKLDADTRRQLLEELADDDISDYFLISALTDAKVSEELLERINGRSPAIRRVLYDALEKSCLMEVLGDETHPLLKTYLEQKITGKSEK